MMMTSPRRKLCLQSLGSVKGQVDPPLISNDSLSGQRTQKDLTHFPFLPRMLKDFPSCIWPPVWNWHFSPAHPREHNRVWSTDVTIQLSVCEATQEERGHETLRFLPAGKLMNLWEGKGGEMSEGDAICPLLWTSVTTVSLTWTRRGGEDNWAWGLIQNPQWAHVGL